MLPTKRFFTADWHLFHDNIIEYCGRPYKDPNQMHQQLVFQHNQVVGPNDEVWVIGDVTMERSEYAYKIGKVVEKFNGIKHLVIGNHDEWRPRAYETIGFATIHTVMWFNHAGFTFFLGHDPSLYTVFENNPQAIQLCGHIHKLFKHLLPEKRIINVGVDVWENPPSMTDIMALLSDHGIEGGQ